MNSRKKSVTSKAPDAKLISTESHPIVNILIRIFSEYVFKNILFILGTNIFDFIQIIDSMKLPSDLTKDIHCFYVLILSMVYSTRYNFTDLKHILDTVTKNLINLDNNKITMNIKNF
jgi:hypothetical protein